MARLNYFYGVVTQASHNLNSYPAPHRLLILCSVYCVWPTSNERFQSHIPVENPVQRLETPDNVSCSLKMNYEWVSLIGGLDSSLEYGTGIWDWNVGLG